MAAFSNRLGRAVRAAFALAPGGAIQGSPQDRTLPLLRCRARKARGRALGGAQGRSRLRRARTARRRIETRRLTFARAAPT